MRVLVCLIGMLVGFPALADVDVIVTMRDGKTVDSRIGVAEITLDATFGKAMVETPHLAMIEFGKGSAPDSVTTDDGTRLSGRVDGDVPSLLNLATGSTARDDVASVVVIRKAGLQAGQITEGTARNRVTYCLRAPEGYVEAAGGGAKLPAILILHGSNMNSKAYVNTIASAWPEIGKKYILIGINGENRNAGGGGGGGKEPAYNYSYINYVGKSKYKGYPGSERESPVLVGEVVRELRGRLPIGKIFVGGHSQGGFLTYSLMMNDPELYAGAFPISAGLIVQCEPGAYDNAEVIGQQKRVPLIIVHATNDRVVGFDSGRYAWESFEDAGYPLVRLLADEMGAHMFARLPIDEAIAWLEEMTSDDPASLLDSAEKWLGAGEEHDVAGVLWRLDGMTLDEATSKRRDELRGRFEAKAEERLRPVASAMDADLASGAWIEDFLAYRAKFGGSKAAAGAMAKYAELRTKQQEQADELFGKAREAFGSNDQKKARELAGRIVKECFASDKYRLAKGWLKE